MSTLLLAVAFGAHVAAAALWWTFARRGDPRSRDRAAQAFAAGMALTTLLIAWRWMEAGRAPFRTRYESLLLFALSSQAALLLVRRAGGALLACFASLAIAGLLLLALLRRDLEVTQLPPALQSPWFVPHVVAYFAGYGTLLVAALASAVVLLGERRVGAEAASQASALLPGFLRSGFLLVSAGMVMGAIWAKAAWGDYWAWDPKECQALVGWLVYALWFHARRLPGWSERRTAWLAIAGFAVVLFGYLGLHLLPTAETSAHVYQ